MSYDVVCSGGAIWKIARRQAPPCLRHGQHELLMVFVGGSGS